MKFLFEVSATPIFQRIIEGFSNALRQIGHDVFLINPGNYSSAEDYLRAIEADSVDYCVLTNALSPLSLLHADGNRSLYELIGQRLIFIHHDNIAIAGFSCDQTYLRKRIAAYQRVAERSCHFCIESSNCSDLKAMGIDNAHLISHASEFSRSGAPDSYSHDVSFVGHVVPALGHDYFSGAQENTIFWGRVAHLDEKIEPAATAHAERLHPHTPHDANWYAAKYMYVSGMHRASQHFRGEIIRRLRDFPLDLFGGDPGYINNLGSNNAVVKPGLKYHEPTRIYAETSSIYAASRINLNITSLQFDDAVINRVIDVAASGGFVLTDWKDGLRNLTSVHSEIAYWTVDELNEKIEYYLVNEKARCEIAEQLHRDITESCKYSDVAEYILRHIP